MLQMETKRIQYIDAMRGFTMILVVFSHICHFCFGDSTMGFNRIFFLFRLPCFFFISGWLFQPVALRSFRPNVRHKAMVQLVPTFIFLLLLAPPPEFFRQLGTLKGGYWFTFVLFEFFMLYMLSVRCCRRWGALLALLISIGSFCLASWQHHLQTLASGNVWIQGIVLVAGVFSISLWRYYLFFYIGTYVRSHFDEFVRLTSRPLVIVVVTVGFFGIAVTDHPSSPVLEYLRFNVGGILGMTMVFTAFRLSDELLQRVRLSRPLQYVGTRTLDIYLLHYFFLPLFLSAYASRLFAYHSQLLEFLVAMSFALTVVIISLLASYVIRLSPFLGHYLFGVKYDKEAKRMRNMN